MNRQITIEITQRNIADYPDTYAHEFAAVARYDGNEFHGEGATEKDAVAALKAKVGLALQVPPRIVRQHIVLVAEGEFSAKAIIEKFVIRRVYLEQALVELRKEVDAISGGREHTDRCVLGERLFSLGNILHSQDYEEEFEPCWCGSHELLEALLTRRPL